MDKISNYINGIGQYLGAFSDENPEIPHDAIKIPFPPKHGWQKWNFTKQDFDDLTPQQKIDAGM